MEKVEESVEWSLSQKVLHNSLLVNLLFEQLDFKSKKNFRLASKHCRNKTLGLWRRRARLKIANHRKFGVTFAEFSKLFRRTADGWREEKYDLTRYPFRNYRVKSITLPLQTGISPESIFWAICGTEMTSLKMYGCHVHKNRAFQCFQWLLLQTCPKLSDLEIMWNELETAEGTNELEQIPSFLDNAVAPKLTKLEFSFDPTSQATYDGKKFLKLLPNLKHLTVFYAGVRLLEGLPYPTGNGTVINLETVTAVEYKSGNLLGMDSALGEYVTKFPNFLRKLDLKMLRLTPEDSQFTDGIHTAIHNCQNLDSLKLVIDYDDSNQIVKTLLPFAIKGYFARLKKLDIYVERETQSCLLFPFEALKQMPNLEELSVDIEPPDWYFEERHFVNKTWGFEDGLRDSTFQLKRLKSFTFEGWNLNDDDLLCISKWFPNLCRLKAPIGLGLVGKDLAEPFRKLKVLNLTNEFPLRPSVLGSLKKAHPNLKIIRRKKA